MKLCKMSSEISLWTRTVSLMGVTNLLRSHRTSAAGADDFGVSAMQKTSVCAGAFLHAEWRSARRPRESRYPLTQSAQGPSLEAKRSQLKPLWSTFPLVDPDIAADKTTLLPSSPQHDVPLQEALPDYQTNR